MTWDITITLAARSLWGARPGHLRPVQIVADLMSPIIYDEAEPLMLDGALQSAVVRLVTGMEPSDAFLDHVGPSDIPIPIGVGLVHNLAVPRVSQAFFGTPPIPAIRTVRKSTDVDALGLDEVKTAFGPYKSHLIPKAGVIAPWVCWYALADVERLRGLLPNVLFLGRSRRQGMGAVVSWAVAEIDEDWSWEFAGNPTRPLPAATGPVVGFRAPHWHPDNRTPCSLHNPAGPRPPIDGCALEPVAQLMF